MRLFMRLGFALASAILLVTLWGPDPRDKISWTTAVIAGCAALLAMLALLPSDSDG